MKNIFLPLLIAIFWVTGTTEVSASKIFGVGSKDYDVVLLGSPISAKEIQTKQRLDAIEGPADDSRQVVVIKIERVLIGELEQVKRGGPSQLDQAGNAIREKKFLGIFETKNPLDKIDRDLFSIAVKNSGETFGTSVGSIPPALKFKIYLKRLSDKPGTFVFIKAVPVS